MGFRAVGKGAGAGAGAGGGAGEEESTLVEGALVALVSTGEAAMGRLADCARCRGGIDGKEAIDNMVKGGWWEWVMGMARGNGWKDQCIVPVLRK